MRRRSSVGSLSNPQYSSVAMVKTEGGALIPVF
jgi:hypothetical protein